MTRKYHQGRFSPVNYQKYLGNPGNIQYRSGWEFSYMSKLDSDPRVVSWFSEEQAIAYTSPIDNKIHRYFVDFYVKMKRPDGTFEEALIEIKPYNQVIPPTNSGKKPSKKFLKEVMEWGKNQAKWKACLQYCKKKNYNFYVVVKDKQDRFQTLTESQFMSKI